jgi:hypothetical protein
VHRDNKAIPCVVHHCYAACIVWRLIFRPAKNEDASRLRDDWLCAVGPLQRVEDKVTNGKHANGNCDTECDRKGPGPSNSAPEPQKSECHGIERHKQRLRPDQQPDGLTGDKKKQVQKGSFSVWFVAGVDPCGWFVEAFRNECTAAALKTMRRLSEGQPYPLTEDLDECLPCEGIR